MQRILAILALVVTAGAAQAQDNWPAKPVRFIVPSSPGGGTDVYARILAQALGESLKAQFIVDNRPGASGNIGAAAAAKSPPDGYTFLVSANPALASFTRRTKASGPRTRTCSAARSSFSFPTSRRRSLTSRPASFAHSR